MYIHQFDIAPKGQVNLTSSVQPSSANELANKAYVDAAIAAGGGDWFASVLDQLGSAPGAQPTLGDRYLVSGTASNQPWENYKNAIAVYNGKEPYSPLDSGAWDYTVPSKGGHVYVEDTGQTMVYNGTDWVVAGDAAGALIATNNLSDLTNPSAARGNLELGDLATQNDVDLGGSKVIGTLPLDKGGTGASTQDGARAALGLGDISTQAASNVDITGGQISGITDLAIEDGGTGASTAEAARGNLGLTIGSDVQAHSSQLDTLAAVDSSDGNFLVGSASGFVAESGATARASLGLGSAAVLDTGVARANLVQAAEALSSGSVLTAGVSEVATLVVEDSEFNYFQNITAPGGSVFGANSAVGVIITADQPGGAGTNGTVTFSITTGNVSDFTKAALDNIGGINISGYNFTPTGDATAESITGLKNLSSDQLKILIGDAYTGMDAFSASKGLASFNSSHFTSTDGFISIASGLTAGSVAAFSVGASDGQLIKAVSLASFSGQSSAETSGGSAEVRTTTNILSAQAGQTVSFPGSGYSFTLDSAPVQDGSEFVMTLSPAIDVPGANYASGQSFEIVGGSGLAPAGAYGTAANVDIATGSASGANGKVLKVAAAANIAADSLLAINASGEIIAGSAGEQGTVTSIALQADDSQDSDAITASGEIQVVGGEAVSTAISNGALQINAAVASSAQRGVVQRASSSTPSGDAVFIGFDSAVSDSQFGQGLMPLINSEGEVSFDQSSEGFYKNSSGAGSFVTLTGHDLEGAIVKNADVSGLSGFSAHDISLPTSVSELKGIYAFDLPSLGSDGSLTLPTSLITSDIGTTVTFKVQGLGSGRKVTINAGAVSGGAKMLIDGLEEVELTQPRQSVTLHLTRVLAGDAETDDVVCWSII
tara:strand:- start:1885 stop:4545 length:2661 start_codon:yes stop_codon:yes gene_type:complete